MRLLEALDQGAVHPFRFVHQVSGLEPVMKGLAWLGSPYVLAGLAALAVLGLAAWGLRRQAVLVAAVVLLAFALGHGTKALVNRARPNEGWSPVPAPQTRSYPSSTALVSAALFGALALFLARRAGRPGARMALRAGGFLLPLLFGASRLLVGHNYLTDVFAGWMAGAALALTAGWLDQAAVPAADNLGGVNPS